MKLRGQSKSARPMMLVIVGALSFSLFSSLGHAAPDLPAASDVIRRLVERSQAVARHQAGPRYVYEKRALFAHLDAGGQTNKLEEKVYQVTLIAGFPFNRLVRIQGRELNSEELKREQRREERFRQRFASGNPKEMAAKREAWVTPQLLERFQFVVKERVNLDNRPTLVLAFSPKPGPLPEKAVQDKFLNRMAGTVWIDEQEAEAARLSVKLTEPVSLGVLGVLGSLSQCELFLERRRMPEGVWVNAHQTLHVQYRKLTSTFRFRATEESSGFKKVS
jgi:hypothetical protein